MRVIISAGGTGGHIIPAIAIMNKIKEKEPDSEFLYIGTHNRMEKDLIPEMGIKYEAITINGLRRKICLDNIKNIGNYLKALKKCKKIISEFKQWSEDKMARFSEEEIEKYMDCLEQTGVIERDITGSYCLSEYLSYR